MSGSGSLSPDTRRRLIENGNFCPNCLDRNAPQADRCARCGTPLPASWEPTEPGWKSVGEQLARQAQGAIGRRNTGALILMAGVLTAFVGLTPVVNSVIVTGITFGVAAILSGSGLGLLLLSETRLRRTRWLRQAYRHLAPEIFKRG
jgi:hypothetical protein